LDDWNLGGVDQPWRNPVRSAAAGSVVARGKKRKTSEEKWFGSSFIGVHCFVEERKRESSHGAGLRLAGGAGVPFGCVAIARDRRPDVAGRRGNSGCGAGGGRGSKATRGRGEGGAGLQRLGKRPAAVDHARAAETEEIGDSRKKTRADCKNSKVQGPHCNAGVTFKPVLKLRWAQKQKCMVFQNLQLFFKVHLQKS
jgi:hypothetical protein